MASKPRCSLVCLFLAGIWSCAFPQDRRIPENLVYPPQAFFRDGGSLIDVTKLTESGIYHSNAAGDGLTDDTKALIAAYDTLAELVRNGADGGKPQIYLPNGTYLVSDEIIYSGERITFANSSGITKVRWIGQDRTSTVIRLKDNCPGFGGAEPRAVLSFYKERGTNIPGKNVVRNITINTGTGNPGAIGIMYMSANIGLIRNVTITSGDGRGHIGLLFGDHSAQGYFGDITVEGFDYGIYNESDAANNPACEYITLRNQNRAAIFNKHGATHLRSVFSRNRCPLVETTGGSVSIIESEARGGAADQSAIQITKRTDALVFARDVVISGYGCSVRKDSTDVLTGNIDEYVSLNRFRLFPAHSPDTTMRLPIADAPEVPWYEDFSQWACVDDYPGATDGEKAQNALNSGKAVVYFPKSSYDFDGFGRLEVPATVKRIDMMFSHAKTGFDVREDSDDALLVENCPSRVGIQTWCGRTIIKRASSGGFANKNNSPAVLFVQGCAGLGANDDFCPGNQVIYAVGINDEIKNKPCFNVNGGVMWCMGYKTEGPQPSFHVHNTGVCEVIGGYRNECMADIGEPVLKIDDNGSVCFTGFTSMAGIFEQTVWETRFEKKVFVNDDFPRRQNSRWRSDIYIPLFLGWRKAEVDAAIDKIRSSAGAYLDDETRCRPSAPLPVFSSHIVYNQSSERAGLFSVSGRKVGFMGIGDDHIPRFMATPPSSGMFILRMTHGNTTAQRTIRLGGKP